MRESTIESHLVDEVKKLGGMAPKFKSPQRANVPDRIVLKYGMLHAARAIEARFPGKCTSGEQIVLVQQVLNAFISFVELKATGEKPTDGQLREHARLRALGFDVRVIDSKEGVDEFLKGTT